MQSIEMYVIAVGISVTIYSARSDGKNQTEYFTTSLSERGNLHLQASDELITGDCYYGYDTFLEMVRVPDHFKLLTLGALVSATPYCRHQRSKLLAWKLKTTAAYKATSTGLPLKTQTKNCYSNRKRRSTTDTLGSGRFLPIPHTLDTEYKLLSVV